MKKVLVTSVFIAITLPVLSVGCSVYPGELKTNKYEYSNFINIQVENAFDVEIAPSNIYSVEITAGENILKRVEVEQTGRTLIIGVEPISFFWNWGNSRPYAKITMPEIAILDVSGAIKVTARGFSSTKDFKLTLSGASSSNIDIEAYDALIDLTGASKVSGNFTGHDVRLDITGASTAQLDGIGNNINLQASGASTVDLNSLASNDVRVDLSGASRAEVLNNGKLDIFLSGASKLQYSGNPEMGTVEVSGGSILSHL
jgi:hypothetical protein